MNNDILVRYNLSYNCVVVIQSLSVDEPQTGLDLYNDIISRRCEKNGVISYFIDITCRNEFFSELEEIRQQVIAGKILPIIHFEIHGNADGFMLSGMEQVNWQEISKHCRDINIVLKNGLVVSLATCKGACIYKLTDIEQPAPFWGFIGPKNDMPNYEIMRDFSSFYDILLESHNLGAALQALNMHNDDFPYAFMTSEMIFDLACVQAKKVPRKNSVVFGNLKSKIKEAFPKMNREQRRQQLKTNQKEHNRDVFLAKMKRMYLMKE